MNTYKTNNLLIKDPDDSRDFIYNTIEEESIQSAVDHTDLMSPVKDQGRLGSCVAFAMCALKE